MKPGRGDSVEEDLYRRACTGQEVEAWFPDFPGLRIPGDRLADTIFSASLMLQRHLEQLGEDGSSVPEPTTPDIWAVHSRPPEALIGFADVETNRVGKEISADETLDDEISRDAQRSGYREEDAVEIVHRHRRDKGLGSGERTSNDLARG
jgi:hypothetical protein